MQLRSGVDLIEIQRFQETLSRHGERFLQRIFTERELAEFRQNTSSLAARFAAKEAVAKALGCGIGAVGWREIEILRGPRREPLLYLHGAAYELAGQLGLNTWSISLSHTHQYAMAMVVAASADLN